LGGSIAVHELVSPLVGGITEFDTVDPDTSVAHHNVFKYLTDAAPGRNVR
jgi:hypothetical protein